MFRNVCLPAGTAMSIPSKLDWEPDDIFFEEADWRYVKIGALWTAEVFRHYKWLKKKK